MWIICFPWAHTVDTHGVIVLGMYSWLFLQYVLVTDEHRHLDKHLAVENTLNVIEKGSAWFGFNICYYECGLPIPWEASYRTTLQKKHKKTNVRCTKQTAKSIADFKK